MANISDFQKSFLARGTNSTLFTQKEFDEALAVAQAQIMQVAISTTKTAIAIEREECSKIVDAMRKSLDKPDMPMMLDMTLAQLAEAIRNRTKQND
jgi:flagellar biosynthesis/type III secretory pathway protein FliH